MGRLRVAIIGLGEIAQIGFLPILSAMENVEIAAIMSKTEEKMKRIASQYVVGGYFSSLEELIKKAKIDCAFVLTPEDLHTQFVIPLLKNKIDVFCEKPMATKLNEAELMVKTAKDNGALLMVGFNRRFTPVYVKAKEAFANSKVEVCFAEKNKEKPGYRQVINNAIHVVDLISWYCNGEPTKVTGYAFYKDRFYEETVAAQIEFHNGSLGIFLMNRTGGKWLEKLELYGDGLSVMVDAPDYVTIFNRSKDTEEVYNLTPLPASWGCIKVTERWGFRQEIEHFLKCVQERKEPLTSGEEALKTHRLVNEIYRQAGLPTLE